MTIDDLLLFIALPMVVLFTIVFVVKQSWHKAQQLEVDSEDVIFPVTADERDEPVSESSMDMAEDVSVTFNKSGKHSPWNPQTPSLLEFAEAQGICVDSYCREGHCGTCQTQLLSGVVEYSSSPRVNVEPGHCLLCISMPKTDLVLEL